MSPSLGDNGLELPPNDNTSGQAQSNSQSDPNAQDPSEPYGEGEGEYPEQNGEEGEEGEEGQYGEGDEEGEYGEEDPEGQYDEAGYDEEEPQGYPSSAQTAVAY